MNTQTLTPPVMICNFVVVPLRLEVSSENPVCASSRDYGFDFDEEEIARELLSPTPEGFEEYADTATHTHESGDVFRCLLL